MIIVISVTIIRAYPRAERNGLKIYNSMTWTDLKYNLIIFKCWLKYSTGARSVIVYWIVKIHCAASHRIINRSTLY